MIDRNMKGHNLREKAGISQSTYFKLQHDQPVSTQMLVRICCALDCELWDITELVDKTGGGPVQFPGKTKLFFQLHDRKGGNHVLLRSRTHEIDVRQDLINFIENYDFLDYNIN